VWSSEKNHPHQEDETMLKTCMTLLAMATTMTVAQEREVGYSRTLDLDGISIEATDAVERDWIWFTGLVVDRMTDGEKGRRLRAGLVDREFRVLLAGPNQLLTELPEYADDPEVAEAAGLGGNPGEYRIAVRTIHPHVLVHEMAHGIYHTVIQYEENDGSIEPEVVEAEPTPGTFTHGLYEAYEAAIEAGTWRGTYFEAHPDEYWAETNLGSELDVELDRETAALLKSDSRRFLQRRDPALYELARSIFTDDDWRPLDTQILSDEEAPIEARFEESNREIVEISRPDFKLMKIKRDGPLDCFHPTFDRHMEVFGIQIVATPRTGAVEIKHAANLIAQYLDNDEDGVIDDPAAHRILIEEGAFLAMFVNESEMEQKEPDFEAIERAGFRIGQGLHADETRPTGPPHTSKRGRFDAALEEVLHLISNGWEQAHPDTLGYAPGSKLTDAMDLARGGRFFRMPDYYPKDAWYHYDDRTCDYQCMAAEYLYWALTSMLEAQDYPGRAREISDEWECPTPELLQAMDPAVYELILEHRPMLPRRLPDGGYRID
jgi:hypothetical protein